MPLHPTPRAKMLTAGLLAALALSPAAFADECDDSLANCEPGQSIVMVPMDLNQLTTTIDVTDRNDNGLNDERALIAKILPEGYGVAPTPQVALQIVDLYAGKKELGSHYGREGSIAINAVHTASGEEGWFHLSTPTDSQTAYDIGRPAGLPKTIMDSMSLEATGNGITANAVLGGKSVFSMSYTATGGTIAGDLRDWTLVRDPYLLQNPPLEGRLYRFKYTVKPYVPITDVTGPGVPEQALVPGVTTNPEPQAGLVEYDLTPNTDALDAGSPAPLPNLFPAGKDLADLIAVTGSAPGAHISTAALLMIQQRDF